MSFAISQLLLELDPRVSNCCFFILKLGYQLILFLKLGLVRVVQGNHVFLLVLKLLPLHCEVGLEVSLLLGEALLELMLTADQLVKTAKRLEVMMDLDQLCVQFTDSGLRSCFAGQVLVLE